MSELEGRAFEFKNGLEFYALQDDEPLLGYVYQPRILKRYLRVVRRLIAPASIIALTDRELITIEDGRTNATSYGWFFTFCPRTNILGIETRPEGALQELRVHLIKDQVKMDHSVALNDETAQAWQTLWMGRGQQSPAVN